MSRNVGPQPAYVGTGLSVRMTGSRFFGNSVSFTSATTALVMAAPVTAPHDPVISGQAIIGSVLTVNPGVRQPAPVAPTYQWQRSGTTIPGATAATYTVTADDKGKMLTVRVTGTKGAYISAQRTSVATLPVATGASPAPVQFDDRLGTPNDIYTVPSATGVEYHVTGNVVAPGTYPGTGTVTVTARAIAGYALVAGSPATWNHTFSPIVFHDVNAGSAFHQEISWLALKGITEGWTEADGTRTFRPAQQVNRDQMAAFL